jgi:predicted small integral membrane protein
MMNPTAHHFPGVAMQDNYPQAFILIACIALLFCGLFAWNHLQPKTPNTTATTPSSNKR